MKAVTLYGQDRYSLLSELPEPQVNYIRECMKDILGEEELDVNNLTAWDIEKYLNINYVDKNRDLSSVKPIEKKDYFIFHNRENFQSLLDALEKGDFELAEALTPEKYRLCGYKELSETTTIEQYGHGWAGHFEFTEVPPGIYPIFAREFNYHERNGHFTNELHYRGVFEWFEGNCVAGSSESYLGPNVVIESPYAYSLAEAADKGTGNVHLIYPFKPVATVHESNLDGKPFTHYTIVDSSLPYKVEKNPIHLRGRCVPPEKSKLSLAEQIHQAEDVKSKMQNGENKSPRSTGDSFSER